jgi:Tfp pilus assembly protein PilO
VGVVLVVILVFIFFLNPRRSELSDVKNQVQTEEQKTVSLQAQLSQLRSLEKDAPRLEAQLQKFKQLVPQNNDVPNFIFQVQQAADASGVSFVSIAPELPKPPPEGAALAEVRITIDAGGGYFALQDFIRRLYALDRAVRIDTLDFQSNVGAGSSSGTSGTTTTTGTATGTTGANKGEITVTMVSRIFYELPPGSSTSSTSTTTTTTPATTPVPTSSP